MSFLIAIVLSMNLFAQVELHDDPDIDYVPHFSDETVRREAEQMRAYRREYKLTHLLERQEVQKELKLTDDQLERIIQVEYVSIFFLKRNADSPLLRRESESLSASPEFTKREFGEFIAAVKDVVLEDDKRVATEIESVLSRKQVKRLRELQFQYALFFKNLEMAFRGQGMELSEKGFRQVRKSLGAYRAADWESFEAEKRRELLFPVLAKVSPDFAKNAGAQFAFERSADAEGLHALYEEVSD